MFWMILRAANRYQEDESFPTADKDLVVTTFNILVLIWFWRHFNILLILFGRSWDGICRNKSFQDCRWSCYDSWCSFTLLVVSGEKKHFQGWRCRWYKRRCRWCWRKCGWCKRRCRWSCRRWLWWLVRWKRGEALFDEIDDIYSINRDWFKGCGRNELLMWICDED